jgi:hypothetical protein
MLIETEVTPAVLHRPYKIRGAAAAASGNVALHVKPEDDEVIALVDPAL